MGGRLADIQARLRALLRPMAVPGWILVALGIVRGLPEVKADWDFWADVVQSSLQFLPMIGELLKSPYLSLVLTMAGLVYLGFIVRRPVHIHHMPLQTQTAPQASLSMVVHRAKKFMPIHEGIAHVAARIGDTEQNDFFAASRKALRQHALDGTLRMRGRKQIDGPAGRSHFRDVEEDIPKSYWADTVLNYLTIDPQCNEARQTQPENAAAWGPKGILASNSYAALRAYWPDVAALWPTAATASLKWLGLNEGIDAFCDPELVSRRNRYREIFTSACDKTHQIEKGMRDLVQAVPGGSWEGRQDDLKKYNELRERLERISSLAVHAETGLCDTWNELRDDIVQKLISGALAAQGFGEPYAAGKTEIQIKPSEWRVLTVNPPAGTAVKKTDPTVIYSGVQIAQAIVSPNATERARVERSDQPDWPLGEALLWLWEHVRTLPKYAPYVERFEASPDTMMGKVAQLAFNRADPPIPLYGVYPPRTVTDLIPPDHVDEWEFSNDASELSNKWWEPSQRYTNLRVKRSDIENRLKAMSE